MKIAIIGAGSVGSALTHVLMEQEAINTLIILDRNGNALDELKQEMAGHPSISKMRTFKVGMEEYASILTLIKDMDVMISALPYKYNLELARIAANNECHFLDLGGNDQVFEKQLELDDLAARNRTYIVPNCGLAPGLLNIIAYNGYKQFDSVSTLEIMSGGLPLNPKPPLNHHLSFSAVGFLEEHLPPVLAVRDGKPVNVEPLSGLEPVSFTSHPELKGLEKFHTGGHITSIAKTLAGSVDNISYKTIRHRGNHDIMEALIKLGFAEKRIIDIGTSMTYRDLLIRKFRSQLPENLPDIVLAKVRLIGKIDGKSQTHRYELVYEYNPDDGHSAIMTCTAVPTAMIAMSVLNGEVSGSPGVKAPEEVIDAEPFLKNLEEWGINIKKSIE
ncbi:saccharopine dehydrogenase C-terminal domain-containing protein [Balneolales bacterium ANBcel1]|nr:saccharopine dehydrogenase C-terminal domain-containing protein [Balneolales bacterium ANBcel1]